MIMGWIQDTFTRYGRLKVPATDARDLSVVEVIPGSPGGIRRSVYRQEAGKPTREATRLDRDSWKPSTGQAGPVSSSPAAARTLDMTPDVELRPGDIVARGNAESLLTMANGGLAVSVERFLETGRWDAHRADVGHVAIAGRDRSGRMGVYEIFVGKPFPELDRLLPENLRGKPHTFVQFRSAHSFFNDAPVGWIRTTMVMRPKDPRLAEQAAARARQMFDTQVSPDGKSARAWYTSAPRLFAPWADGRTGPCSSFVNKAYDHRFDPGHGIPVSPESITESSLLQLVGMKTVEDVRKAGTR
ncbi:MAG: hypothetical protein VKP72_13340 [bacterium]|nr:hypothetical protein [bacterium]